MPNSTFSCFISYRRTDNDFAARLHSDLVANAVNCWKDDHDMEGGKFVRTQIAKAIKDYDKLILVCSTESMVRTNVVEEIIAAIEVERETKRQKLFPIRLDDFILEQEILTIADEKMQSGEWREDWVRYVRAYHIPDFSGWKNSVFYKREFAKLLRDLTNPAAR